MKIGILTYHRVVNDGSVLQAYCLYRILQEIFPDATVELIDYCSSVLRRYNRRSTVRLLPPRVNLAFRRKQHTLQQFLFNHCRVSRTRCTTDNVAVARDFLHAQDYDALVVGSDTVWEVRSNSIGARMAPNIFFLPDVSTGVRKIAFAASADPYDPEVLRDESLRRELSRYVNDFDFISVRDDATSQLLGKLDVAADRQNFMPDPAILWDFSEILPPARNAIASNARLAAVAVAGPALRSTIARTLHAAGYGVVSLLGSDPSTTGSARQADSFPERLDIYRRLDLVVTDRFHGSILALTLGTAPIIFVEDVRKWRVPNGKGRDLFKRLGLEALVWRPNGREFTKQLLDSYLDAWDAASPKIPTRIFELRDEATSHLHRIQNIVVGRTTQDSLRSEASIHDSPLS